MENCKTLKDVLSKEEYENMSVKNINTIIETLRQKGYKDDFLD